MISTHIIFDNAWFSNIFMFLDSSLDNEEFFKPSFFADKRRNTAILYPAKSLSHKNYIIKFDI